MLPYFTHWCHKHSRITKLKQVKKMTSADSDALMENPQQEKYHLIMMNRL